MNWTDQLNYWVGEIYNTKADVRNGLVVPRSSSVKMESEAVKVEAAFLYADLAGSSKLADTCPWPTTAKLIRSYLVTSVRLIRAWGGHIRSFDGDRVMGVFMGDAKEALATNCAREIDWTVTNVLNPLAKKSFKSVADNGLCIRHCVGVDVGESRAVRAGIRDNSDLIWIGKAPSFAAKLSDTREYPYEVYISDRVFRRLPANQKTTSTGEAIWEARTFTFAGKKETVHRTKFPLKP